MNRAKILFSLSAAIVIMASCASNPRATVERPTRATSAAKSEYFKTSGALVLAQKDAPSVQFSLHLLVLKPLPEGSTVIVDFENPPNPSAPFAVAVAAEGKDEIRVASPEFEGIYNRRAYLSQARIIDKDGKEIARHQQWIWFEMPGSLAAQMKTKILR
jgi:hypothetical protein